MDLLTPFPAYIAVIANDFCGPCYESSVHGRRSTTMVRTQDVGLLSLMKRVCSRRGTFGHGAMPTDRGRGVHAMDNRRRTLPDDATGVK